MPFEWFVKHVYGHFNSNSNLCHNVFLIENISFLDSSSDESGYRPSRTNLLTPRNTRMGSNIGGVHTLGLSNKLKSRTHVFCTKTIIYPENCTTCGKR
jgi:hypothetical protein